MKNIFVGNLGLRTSEDGLRTLFELYGTVQSVKLVTERDTGRSRGFAFIEMSNDAEAEDAITALNGTSVGGRTLKVSESRPRHDRAFRNRSAGDETGIGSNRKFGPLRVRQPQW
jgi:RNA recognition motif-containing protein